MLVVLLLLPFSLAMDKGEFEDGGGSGDGGGSVAAEVVAVVVMDDNWQQKRPAMRALMVG
jgi:hypothetical protein